MVAFLNSTVQAVTSTLFPPVCVVCGGLPSSREYICADCQSGLHVLRAQPACPFCGCSPGPHLFSGGNCGQCQTKQFRVDGTARVAPYVDPMVELLRQFKYKRAEYLDRFLADLMTRSLEQAAWCGAIEAIVPVPSHWLRRITDGFYPVTLLAAEIGRRIGLPCLSVVRRVKFERHQVGLPFAERIRNVRGAFEVQCDAVVRGARVCVVDDVMTSGATLNEMAKVLKTAGAAKVYNLVLARAGRQDAALGIA